MNISLKKKKPTIALISSSILASVSLLLPWVQSTLGTSENGFSQILNPLSLIILTSSIAAIASTVLYLYINKKVWRIVSGVVTLIGSLTIVGMSLLTIAGMKLLFPDGGIWSVSYGGFVATGLGVLMFYFAVAHLKSSK
mgnify:FL=1